MNQNTLTNPRARKPLTRATLGIGLALATIGAAGLGGGIARAVPLQPLLVDDPLPVPTPAGPNPTSPVNIANAIFAEISNALSAVFPGSSSVLMPGDTPTSPLSPGMDKSGLVPPGQASGLPAYPGATPPGYPSSVAPRQAPNMSSNYVDAVPGGPGDIPRGNPTSDMPRVPIDGTTCLSPEGEVLQGDECLSSPQQSVLIR